MATENETLLTAVLRQINVTKLDYGLLASEIGAPTAMAARLRWGCLHKKLMSSKSTGAGRTSGVQKSIKSPAESRRPTSNSNLELKEVAAGSDADAELPETPPRKLPARKARVVSFKEESTDDEQASNGGADIDVGAMEDNEESVWE